MFKQDLQPKEFDNYYWNYINKLSDEVSLIDNYIKGKDFVMEFFLSIPKNKLEFRYEPNKWSIKEILQHLIDTERIFMYRCFRIARRDDTMLTGFDQNIYIEPSRANEKTLQELLKEFELNRNNSINVLQSFSNDDLTFIGNSNGNKMSARAAAFVIPGHDIWHIEVIKERYL